MSSVLDGLKQLLVASPFSHAKYALLVVIALLFQGVHKCVLARRANPSSPRRHAGKASGRHRRPTVRFDSTLFWRVVGLLRICFPSVFSPESGAMVALTLLLALRTRLTLMLSRVAGNNVKALVQKNFRELLLGIGDIALYALPATVVNVSIGYTISSIEWRFRERLQQALHKEYFQGRRVYDLATTGTVDNPGHRVTNDVQCFSRELAVLIPSILKPSMDIVTFSSALAEHGGHNESLLIFSYYAFVAVLFRLILPNFATMMAASHAKEGNLRTMHTQLLHHAEEVAFYRGADVERATADRLLRSYLRLESNIKRLKWWGTLVSSMFVEYGSTCVGLAVCGFDVARRADSMDAAGMAQLYARNAKLCTSLAKSIARLFSIHLKVSAVCGGAHRVGELQDSLRSLERNERETTLSLVEESSDDKIVFKNAYILSPSDKMILANYNATFKAGRHVLIMGCNGAGKTALIRVITGVWSLREGSLKRPPPSQMVVLTQRVYLPPGTLRTQFTYPTSEADKRAGDIEDAKLVEFATRVGLRGLLTRVGGLDAWKEWSEVLSGGERQRVAFVRALYHRPTFVFLDECTSAVSQNIEPTLYKLLLDEGMTLITTSHRESLKKFHHDIMMLDGVGGYTETEVGQPRVTI
ncbi:ABC transporter, putative [Trypanosoma brucei gambiense DAL972]|uniref:ABC transporter, putative n=2 Tax=Trypanosoma brucei TaxID=5691 RepID=D0A6C8_TRYB9|nr:ABC transporter, putative [Trypanosoma brucei gambiense DAL972]RHW68374.1 glycosomal transporter (GAT2) [Trypanosoma brucei equiperdum]CBH17229.1 ABC transporter, putative [Trypanosoma brucei gambiense DAL972]|eukprot:XP_011779493.1 ABC transporter, putative [Trypanosoma brucei gambiense DAL972]